MKIEDRVANEIGKKYPGAILQKSEDAFSDASFPGGLNVFLIQLQDKKALLVVTDEISDTELEYAVKVAIEDAI